MFGYFFIILFLCRCRSASALALSLLATSRMRFHLGRWATDASASTLAIISVRRASFFVLRPWPMVASDVGSSCGTRAGPSTKLQVCALTVTVLDSYSYSTPPMSRDHTGERERGGWHTPRRVAPPRAELTRLNRYHSLPAGCTVSLAHCCHLLSVALYIHIHASWKLAFRNLRSSWSI